MSRIGRLHAVQIVFYFGIIAWVLMVIVSKQADAQTLRVPPIQEHSAPLEFAGFAMGGKRLVTADADSIIVWDAESGKALERIAKKPRTTRVSTSGEMLVYAEPDANSRTLIVRSLKDDTTVEIPCRSNSDLTATEFSRDGNFLSVPGSRREQWSLWDVRNGSLVAQTSLPPYDSKEVLDFQKRMMGQPEPQDTGTPIRRLIGWKTGGPNQTPLVLDSRNVESQFSPTGKHYLSVNWHDTGSSTAQASLWDAQTFKLIHFYESPVSATQHIQYLRNSEQFLIGASSKAIELRETAAGKLIRTIGPLPETIRLLDVDPQEKWAVTLERDGRLSTWNLESGAQIAQTKALDEDLPRNMAILGADQLVLPGKATRIYSLPDLAVKHEIPLSATRVRTSPAADRFVLYSNSHAVRLMDATGKPLKKLMRLPARRLVLSPNGEWALGVRSESGSPSDSPQLPLAVWETKTGKRLLEFPPTNLAFDYSGFSRSPLDRSIEVKTANRPGTVRLRKRGFGRPLFPVRLRANVRTTVADAKIDNAPLLNWLLTLQANDVHTQRRFKTARNELLTGTQLMVQRAGRLEPTVWNTMPSSRVIAEYQAGKVQHRYEIDDLLPTAATLSNDKSKVVVAFAREGQAAMRHAVGVFDTANGKLLYRLDGTPTEVKHKWPIVSLTLSPNDRYLIVSFDYHDYLVDLQQVENENTGREAYVFIGEGYSGLRGRENASFSSDSTRVVVLGYQRTLWDATNGKQLAVLGAYNGCWNYVFSPNSSFLYIDGQDGPQLLEAGTGDRVHKFQQGVVPEFSNDGSLMVARRWGIPKAHLWNFNEGKTIFRISPRNSATVVYSLFNPSGSRLITMEHDGDDSICTVYDTATGTALASHRVPGKHVFNMNGSRPTLIGEDKVIVASDTGATMWSFETAGPVQQYETKAPLGRFVREDERLLVLGTASASVWDIYKHQRIASLQHVPRTLTLRPMPRFAPNGDIIALHDRGLSVGMWDAGTGTLKARHHCINQGVDWFVGIDQR